VADALISEEQRHTGAGGFVWSSTVENNFAVAGQPVVFLLQLLGVHAEGAGNGFGISFEIHGMAKIDDDQLFAGIDFYFQFVDGDAADAQFTQEALACDKFLGDVRRQDADEDDQEPSAKTERMFGDALDLAAEDVAQAEKSTRPDKRTTRIEEQKAPGPHVKDARERRGHGAESREKLGQEQGPRALLGENAFGATNTRIGLQRDLAEKLENLDAFETPERVPDGVRGNRGKDTNGEASEKIQVAGAGKRTRGQQQGKRRNRQADLLSEYPSQQNHIAVMEKKFEGAVHGWEPGFLA